LPYAVFDTNSLLGALINKHPFCDALEKLQKVCDRVVISNPIQKEFISKLHSVGLTIVVFNQKMSELSSMGKIKRLNKTHLLKAKRMIKKQRLRLPNDKEDHKFIEAAVASSAGFLVTADNGILILDPYRYNKANSTIRILSPENYVHDRQSSENKCKKTHEAMKLP